MSKFDSICQRIQEAMNSVNSSVPGLVPKPIPGQKDLDIDALSDTLAKTTDPAAIKKALSPLIGSNQANQPSISMTGTSGPTTSTTNQAGQRVQTPTTNTGSTNSQQSPTTNTQAAKQSMSDDEVDNILKDIQVDKIIQNLQKRTNYKHEG